MIRIQKIAIINPNIIFSSLKSGFGRFSKNMDFIPIVLVYEHRLCDSQIIIFEVLNVFFINMLLIIVKFFQSKKQKSIFLYL
jgi:hypothetical protein